MTAPAGSATVPPKIRPGLDSDAEWTRDLLASRWGSPTILSRGRTHDASCLPSPVAELDGERVGLATYQFEGGAAELVSLDALVDGRGVGSALLQAIEQQAKAAGCRRLWLVTTNDNLDALRFYQRRGLRIVKVHRGGADEARKLKPEIPDVGLFGIPIHDEIELELRLDPPR